jgi:hypothetical protein
MTAPLLLPTLLFRFMLLYRPSSRLQCIELQQTLVSVLGCGCARQKSRRSE